MPRGGAGSTGKWPLTGFLAGESPNQTWGAMLTDFNGQKAVGISLATPNTEHEHGPALAGTKKMSIFFPLAHLTRGLQEK